MTPGYREPDKHNGKMYNKENKETTSKHLKIV